MAKTPKGFSTNQIILVMVGALVIMGFIYVVAGRDYVEKWEDKSFGEANNNAMMKDQPERGQLMTDEPGVVEKKENKMGDEARGEERSGDSMMNYGGIILAGTSAPLLDFRTSDYDAALKTDKLIVLYFYANWCPICRAEFPMAEAAFNSLESDDVIGFRVNFNDNQTDEAEVALARQFGVAYQHTKVFVKNGERVLKSPETWDNDRYLSEIAKY